MRSIVRAIFISRIFYIRDLRSGQFRDLPMLLETWEWSHCVSFIKTHRYICNMTYLGHYVTLTWGQILTLTFQGHAIQASMRLDEANTMVSKSLLYHFKHGSYHRKTVSLKNAVFDLSWPLTPEPLVLGEIWRQLSERAFQELSIAFLNFDVAVTGTEIMRIIWSHVIRAGRVHELSRSSRSKFKMVLHQFSSVQFPSRQLAWKVRSVQFIEVLRF